MSTIQFIMNLRLFLLLVTTVPIGLFAQIAHLKKELAHPEISDIKKAEIYIELSKAYWKEHIDSATLYTDKAYNLAYKTNNREHIARALIQKSILSNYQGNEAEALEYLNKAREIVTKHHFKAIEADLYNKIGLAHRVNTDSALLYYNKSIDLAKELGFRDLVLRNKIRISRLLMHHKEHTELARLYDILIPELESAKNYDGLMEIYTYMSIAFRDLNEEGKSLLYADKAVGLSNKVNDKKLKAFVYGALGSGVKSYFETFEKAEPFLKKSIEYAREINDRQLLTNNRKRMAILHYNNDNFATASEIIDSLLTDTEDPDVFKTKGMILYEQQKYYQANAFYDKAYKLYEKEKAYIQQKVVLQLKLDSKLALLGEEELTHDFLTLDSLMAKIHETDSKNQFFDLETKYHTAEKEAEIQRKELALATSHNRILIISALAILLLGSAGFGIWYMRNRQRRNELEQANRLLELQNSLNATELANLNNQLNPHEIKNLITSIAPDIIAKAPEAYKKMIRLFNVTRASLSDELTQPLDIQVQQAEDYLLLKQSVSAYPWEFEILNDTEDTAIALPRLLLKNMVENAVKHGMKRMKDDGKVILQFSKTSHYLHIIIKDNGPGSDETRTTESTGIGFSTYQKLFRYANGHNAHKASLTFERQSPWTVVEIKVPLDYEFQRKP